MLPFSAKVILHPLERVVIASFNHFKAALFMIIASWIHIFAIFSVLFILFYLRSPFLSVEAEAEVSGNQKA